jgi:hypothetical protein
MKKYIALALLFALLCAGYVLLWNSLGQTLYAKWTQEIAAEDLPPEIEDSWELAWEKPYSNPSGTRFITANSPLRNTQIHISIKGENDTTFERRNAIFRGTYRPLKPGDFPHTVIDSVAPGQLLVATFYSSLAVSGPTLFCGNTTVHLTEAKSSTLSFFLSMLDFNVQEAVALARKVVPACRWEGGHV